MAEIQGGLNIGQAELKVELLSRSPFSGQQKQETSIHFTQDVFGQLRERENVTVIPPPLNGIRVTEDLQGFDNFLTDGENRLEDAFFEQTVEVEDEDGDGTTTISSQVSFDSSAVARVRELGLLKEGADGADAGDGADAEGQGDGGEQEAEEDEGREISSEQKNFFTWQVTNNIFTKNERNPDPPKFTEPPPLDNTPEWTYAALPRPGNDVNNLMLTPFMKKNPPDSASPVHWGCTMTESLAKNQPFEIAYFFCLRDPAIAKDAPKQTPRYKFVGPDGVEIDMKLTSAVYLGIEFGRGSDNNFLLMFVNETFPFIFQLGGSGKNRQAILLGRFQGFNAAKLFNPNNKFFTINIEPVFGSFIVRSNVFSDTPWLINAPISDPVFIGEGPITLYGGNVQAGFALRPIQYADTGSFKTPENTFNIPDETVQPICTTEAKGIGAVEQLRSYGGDGGSVPTMHMVDSEKVNGEGVTSVLEANSQLATEGNSVQREINFTTDEVTPEGQPASSGRSITKTFENKVILKPGDVTQGNGFVVKRGRSPYILSLRCEVPSTGGGNEGFLQDISCDVMSVDLNWNATSYQEIRHTGTITVLNLRNVSGTDYRQFSNRSLYLRISAGWKAGVGDEGLNTIFTGKTMKVDVTTRAEREVVVFQIEDYMAALDGVKFVLSPFYDGMSASLAVRDIVLQSGLSDDRILTNNTQISKANLQNDLGLPLANPLVGTPKFRFKDGSSLKDGILKIAKLDFKTIFFDADGNFHYEDMPGGIFNNKNFAVKEEFWSTADRVAEKPHNQAWNLVTFSRLINDVYNVIQVLGVDKRLLARLSAATAYNAGITDPDAEGYLGYRKHLFIAEPALGSLDAMFRYLDNYRRRVTIPPLTGKFEIFGRNNLQPLDVIRVDGQLFRIMNIQSRINKAENTFYQNIEGEWMFAVGTGKDQQPEITPTNSTGNSTSGPTAGSSSVR